MTIHDHSQQRAPEKEGHWVLSALIAMPLFAGGIVVYALGGVLYLLAMIPGHFAVTGEFDTTPTDFRQGEKPPLAFMALVYMVFGTLCLSRVSSFRTVRQVYAFVGGGALLIPSTYFVLSLMVWPLRATVAFDSFTLRLIGFAVAIVAGLFSLGILTAYLVQCHKRETQTIRGRQLRGVSDVQRTATELTLSDERTLSWGGIQLPERFSENHFCIMGATGSGKTATMTHLLRSVLADFDAGRDTRVVIYDAKRDIRSMLHQLAVPDDKVVMMNPLDARSAPWDIAADVTEPLLTEQIASIVIPTEQGPNKYFSDAARALVAGVMKALMLSAAKRPDGVADWTLRDVLMIARNEKRLREVLPRVPATAELIEQYFGGGVTFDNIKSTIASNVALLEPIAALWAKSSAKPVSFRKWCTSQSVLVIGNDDSLRAPLDAVNRVIFQRLFELVLGQGDSLTRRTWFFLDELKEAGPLPMLPRLLTKGRSVGARVVIGFQDISGLHYVYGSDLAGEITGMCGNKAILRLDSDVAAHWASQAIGEAEVLEYTRNESFARDGTSHSINEQIRTRQLAIRDELKDLPVPQAGVFDGYYITPAVGVFRNSVRVLPLERGNTEMNFHPRPVEEQYLDAWSDGDWQRLGVVTVPEEPPQRQLTLGLNAIRRLE